jgi:hypothetical protein
MDRRLGPYPVIIPNATGDVTFTWMMPALRFPQKVNDNRAPSTPA